MRRAFLIAGILLVATSVGGQAQRASADVPMPAHPRLLLLRGEEQGILRDIAADSSRRRIHQAIISGADELLLLPPVQRISASDDRLVNAAARAIRGDVTEDALLLSAE